MDVTPTATTAAATQVREKQDTGTGAAANAIAGDFNTFLKLLTAQMRNQDPLQPTDNTEFVAQLASFSAVEQQIQTNNALAAIQSAVSGTETQNLAGWIGREVLSKGPVSYAGGGVDLEMMPEDRATRADLVVRDAGGALVARIAVPPAGTDLTWDGRNGRGGQVPAGLYSFEVESFDGEVLLGSQPALSFTGVSEVRVIDGQPELVLAGGGRMAVSDVRAVR